MAINNIYCKGLGFYQENGKAGFKALTFGENKYFLWSLRIKEILKDIK